MLLDEPVNHLDHLDIRNQLETMTVLREITQEMNLLTIIVLHDLIIVLRYIDRCVMTPVAFAKSFSGMHALIREIDGIPVVLPLGSASC